MHPKRYLAIVAVTASLVALAVLSSVAGGDASSVSSEGPPLASASPVVIDEAPAVVDGDVAPQWLSAECERVINTYPGADVATTRWVLSTVQGYHDSLPDLGPANPESADRPVYVVVVDGAFAESVPPASPDGKAASVTGRQLMLVFDVGSQTLSTIGILTTPVDTAELGDMQGLRL